MPEKKDKLEKSINAAIEVLAKVNGCSKEEMARLLTTITYEKKGDRVVCK